MRYLAVLFDFFGTLTAAVKRGPEHARVARSLGCEPADWYSLLNRTFYDRAVGALGTPYEVLSDLARQAGGQPSDASVRRAVFDRISVTRADAPLRPDATATLRRLRRAGIRTAVVSDCWYELPALMPALPVAGLLNATVYSCRLGRSKPHPDMYLTACDRLRVPPERCLYVGDGSSRELTGADGVGMTAVRLVAADLAHHLAFNIDAGWTGPVVESLSDVVALASPDPNRETVAA